MKLSTKYYYSDTTKLGGVKIINKEFRSRHSDWDLYIYPLGLIIDNKLLWEIIGVDEI